MTVRKFKSVEAMKRDRWREPGAPDLLQLLAGLWQLGLRTRRSAPPPGVYKHRSIQEAKARKEAWAATTPERGG